MGNNEIELVGSPCGQHGPYTFYKAFRYSKNGSDRLMTLSEFFFVKLWSDSDLVCIGELQLLWVDKNSEQVLCSLRLYFLPENTPEGRMDHGEDEVLAISEKVVLRVEDLLTWITMDAEWSWGRVGHYDGDVKSPPPPCPEDDEEDPLRIKEEKTDGDDNSEKVSSSTGDLKPSPISSSTNTATTTTSLLCRSSVLVDNSSTKDLDIKFFEKDSKALNGPAVIVLSYPRYCRYRALMKRLQGVEDQWLKSSLVAALGGFTAPTRNTRILFCRDTFDYPDLEGHELLCNHLAPKLKGRPRGKRKKRSISPVGSESNESESNECNVFSSSKVKLTTTGGRNGLRCNSSTSPRRSTRSSGDCGTEWEFLSKLNTFMKSHRSPIGRVPTIGSKEMDLHQLFNKVQKLGGYEHVTSKRLWKGIFEDLGGGSEVSGAATVIRRHYERLLLPYERYLNANETKPAKTRRAKCRADSSNSDGESNNSMHSNASVVSVSTADKIKTEGKVSSLRSVRVKPDRLRDTAQHHKQEKDPTRNGISSSETTPTPDQVVYNVRVTSTISSMANAENNRIPPILEGKENVPMLRSLSNEDNGSERHSATNDELDPSGNNKNAMLINVKKRKLDILKEGGLEVTPIPIDAAVILKDSPISAKHASIINHVSITVTSDNKGSSNGGNGGGSRPSSSSSTASSSSGSASAPARNGIQPAVTPNFYGQSPPKVVQSKSIYSYSEKTVYGNPKDTFMPPPPPTFHLPRNYTPRTPKSVANSSSSSASAGDILDLSSGATLSRNSHPHKPIVEIVKVPSVPHPNRYAHVAQAAHAAHLAVPPSLMDNKRLGSNLEITLVGAKGHELSLLKGNNQYAFKRSSSGKIVSQNNHAKTNGKQNSSGGGIQSPNHNQNQNQFRYEGNPKPAKQASNKSNNSNSKAFQYGPAAQMLPGYLSQLNSVLKGSPTPILPILDPFYYSALCSQNLLPGANSANATASVSSEQLQFYKNLMRMQSYQWMGGQDGANAMTVNQTNGSNRKDK